MNNEYLARAREKVPDAKTLIVLASKRARLLATGAPPMVRCKDENFLDVGGIQDILLPVVAVGEDEVHPGIGRGGNHQSVGNISERRAVNVGIAENRRHLRPPSGFRGYSDLSTALLRRLLEQRYAHSHLTGSTGSEERVGKAAHLLRSHPPSVVSYNNGKQVGGRILVYGQGHTGRTGTDGILDYIQYMHGKVVHLSSR